MREAGCKAAEQSCGTYVILTAARNEQDYIERTLKSVVMQSVLPLAWYIVSDGSTDATDRIVEDYARRHSFITLQRIERESGRNFGSKAAAINAAYEYVRHLKPSYVGVLDADVSFAQDYYQSILEHFAEHPRLGVAGGLLYDRTKTGFRRQKISPHWSVSGPVQMFRRDCFEAIGGYLPIRGGIDAMAEVMARMKGWEVRTFTDIPVLHHRPTGAAYAQSGSAHFAQGKQDYCLGYHPVFALGRSLCQLGSRPYGIGAAAMLCGYLSCCVRHPQRQVPDDVVHYLRREQLLRLPRAR